MIMRAESWVTVSSTWPAKNTIAVSMMANSSAKKTGATSANSTAAEPRRLRRKRRSAVLVATSEGIAHSSGATGLPSALAETDCRIVSPDRSRMHRSVNLGLTFLQAGKPVYRFVDRGHDRSGPVAHCDGLAAAAPAAW